jgi:hypothetical protein
MPSYVRDAHAQQKRRLSPHTKKLNFCMELTRNRNFSNKLDKTKIEAKGAQVKFWK